jgi:MoaA/NifB/PqqE/SkfB family radical SAM enzyme
VHLFDRLGYFKDLGIKTTIQTVVTMYNLDKIEEKVEKASKFDHKIHIMPAFAFQGKSWRRPALQPLLQNAIVATTLRYKDEVMEPVAFCGAKGSARSRRGGACPDDEDSLVDKLRENCASILKRCRIRCYIPHKVMQHFIA